MGIMRGLTVLRPERMDTDVLTVARACLAERGQLVSRTAVNLRGIIDSFGVDQEDALECVTQASIQLYPEAPWG